MKVIKKRPARLSKDGKHYWGARPSFHDLQDMHQEFIDCVSETLKPFGLVASTSGFPKVEWFGEYDMSNLNKLKAITFNLEMVNTSGPDSVE